MSEHTFSYRLGPGPLDVAARFASGWVRLLNNRRLPEHEVEGWVDLVPRSVMAPPSEAHQRVLDMQAAELRAAWEALPESVSGDAAPEGTSLAERIRALAGKQRMAHENWGTSHQRLLEARSRIEELEAKLAEQASQPEQTAMSPDQIRAALLRQFADHPGGLTVREAAFKAGVLGLSNYTSRFATDLRNQGLIQALVELVDDVHVVQRRDGGKLWKTTEAGWKAVLDAELGPL